MSQPGPVVLDLKQEQRRIYRGVAFALIVCGVVLGASHVALPRLIQLPGDDLEARLTFWASASLFVLVWVMLGVGMVSRGRRRSVEDIRGAAYSGAESENRRGRSVPPKHLRAIVRRAVRAACSGATPRSHGAAAGCRIGRAVWYRPGGVPGRLSQRRGSAVVRHGAHRFAKLVRVRAVHWRVDRSHHTMTS